MWFLYFIIIVVVVILLKFCFDNYRMSSSLKKEGGMAVKYCEVLDACLKCENAKVLQESPSFISIGGNKKEGYTTVHYAFWFQHTHNQTLNVKFVIRSGGMPQRVVKQWNFNHNTPQMNMIKAMQSELNRFYSPAKNCDKNNIETTPYGDLEVKQYEATKKQNIPYKEREKQLPPNNIFL